MQQETVSFKNFNLKLFRSLLEQNLMVDNQITMRFEQDIIKSAALTISQSMLKLWACPIESFKVKKEVDNQTIINFDDEDDDQDVNEYEGFDLNIYRGDSFIKYMSVYGSDSVDMDILIDRETNTAALMTIKGQSIAGNNLSSKYILSTDETIMNKISDYGTIMEHMTPDENMIKFVLAVDEMKELKQLIKQLHKIDTNNTSYIKFSVNKDTKTIDISDNVFNVKYSMLKNQDSEIPEKSFEFNILKSDFIVAGSHTFIFNVNPDTPDDQIIIQAIYNKCVIYAKISKAVDKSNKNDNIDYVSGETDILNSNDIQDIEEYFD